MTTAKKQGFTLIELLVVIAIIAILSAIGLVALNGAREKARDAQRRSDIAQIRTALSLYYDDHESTYPLIGEGAETGEGVSDLIATDNVPDSSDNSTETATPVGNTLIAGGTLTSNYLAQALKGPTSDGNAYDQYFYITNEASGVATPISATAYMVFTQLEAAGKTNFYGINEQGTVWDIADDVLAVPTAAAADICDNADTDANGATCDFTAY